jgi:hypothetical protein
MVEGEEGEEEQQEEAMTGVAEARETRLLVRAPLPL